MKKIVLLITVFSCFEASAQVPAIENNTKPVKLQDVINAYKISSADEEETGENEHYHLGRWLWYWRQHTDQNGYLVSPAKNYAEWKKYNSVSAAKSTAASKANWVLQGPTNSAGGYYGLGRINAIEFHPTDSNTYWVCTAGGGIWKTTNDGSSWTCLTDKLPVLGSSDLDVNRLNPNSMFLCTGDRDHSDTYSLGVLKSTNGGQTWDTTGLTWTTTQFRLANCLVVNKSDTNSLTLAASNGIYKSNDGGANWNNVQSGHFKQVLYHPTDTNVLYATRYNDGTNDAQIFRSANGGASWTQITSLSGMKRITLAVSPANVRIVKAIVANSTSGMDGIYSSKDTGKTFTKIYTTGSGCSKDLISSGIFTNATSINSCGKQGWYDLTIAISPTDTAKVYVGAVNSWYSSNGGTSFTILNQWRSTLSNVAVVHADKHMMTFNPLRVNKFFECNDGGVYKVTNPTPTATWVDATNGISATQFYRNAVDKGASFVLGGSQDNGTKGLQNTVWVNVGGGDGMDCHIDYNDSDTYYTATQYGNLTRVTSSGSTDITPITMDGGWITPYIISPQDNNHLVAGYKNIYWTPNQGGNWYQVTTDSLNYTRFIYRLAMTPASSSTIYATIENTNDIYYTHGFVPSSVQGGNKIAFASLNCPYGGNISDIKVDRKNKDHFWVSFEGYGTNKVAEYKSGNWSLMNNNIPNVPVLCLEIDTTNDIMYIGTDVGVFYYDSTTKPLWQPFNTNMPVTPVTDLGINYTTKEIWASTFGRGMWSSAKQDYDTTNSIKHAHIENSSSAFIIAPNPNNGSFTVRTFSKQLKDAQVTVTISDNAGRVVWSTKDAFDAMGKMQVDAEGLPNGMYIVDMETNHVGIGRQKLIINR